jgi:hypothetical protein
MATPIERYLTPIILVIAGVFPWTLISVLSREPVMLGGVALTLVLVGAFTCWLWYIIPLAESKLLLFLGYGFLFLVIPVATFLICFMFCALWVDPGYPLIGFGGG